MDDVLQFAINHLEEVKNQIGGVVGYRLILTINETEKFLKLIDQIIQERAKEPAN